MYEIYVVPRGFERDAFPLARLCHWLASRCPFRRAARLVGRVCNAIRRRMFMYLFAAKPPKPLPNVFLDASVSILSCLIFVSAYKYLEPTLEGLPAGSTQRTVTMISFFLIFFSKLLLANAYAEYAQSLSLTQQLFLADRFATPNQMFLLRHG